MSRKIVHLFVALTLSLTSLTLFSCGGNSASGSGGGGDADIWGVNAAVKVLQDYGKAEYGSAVTEAKLVFDCIKGETESAQFIITPKTNVQAFDFSVSEAECADNGAKISSGAFEVFAEKYIEVVEPTALPGTSKGMAHLTGWWPDAIIPIKNYILCKENKIKADENQGIWVNVNVSEDTESGTYVGKGVLELDGKKYDIPVTVNVYDLTLPKEMHNRLAFGLWYDNIATAGVSVKEDTYSKYYWFLANKRITPTAIVPDYVKSGVGFANAVVEYAKAAIVSGYNLDVKGVSYYDASSDYSGTAIDYDYLVEVLNAMIDKNIELRLAGEKTETGGEIDLFKKLYIYLGGFEDEPTPQMYNLVKENDRRITRAKNALKSRLDAYPDLQHSFTQINHVVTATPLENLVGTDETGGVQTWCSTVGQYQSEKRRNWYYSRLDNAAGREYGEKTWWYLCEADRSPYATYFIDDNLISARITTYMQYDYRVSGSLYWCTNYAYKYTGPTTVRDYWSDPQTWFNVNGDGFLTYPGTKYKMSTPISTIRLEALRESEEDYEYFWMLEQEVDKYNSENGTDIDAKAIFREYFAELYDGTMPDLDSTKLIGKRVSFIKFLESVVKDSSALSKYIA